MAQFDVFVNPIIAARRAYPYVVTLQCDLMADARDQVVAPLVPRESLPMIAGRLTPIVSLDEAEYVVLVPALAGVRASDLKTCRGSIAAARTAVLAAIDYLFFGV